MIKLKDGIVPFKWGSWAYDQSLHVKVNDTPEAKVILVENRLPFHRYPVLFVFKKEDGRCVSVRTRSPIGIFREDDCAIRVIAGASALEFWIPILEGCTKKALPERYLWLDKQLLRIVELCGTLWPHLDEV